MLVVTVELWPRGDRSRARHLGTARIANVGGTRERGEYSVALSKWGRPDESWRTGVVRGFPRLQRGPWDLLLLALHATCSRRVALPAEDRP